MFGLFLKFFEFGEEGVGDVFEGVVGGGGR